MTPEQIQRALKGRIEGEVYSDSVTRALYSTAACIYRMVPQAVAVPRSVADAQTIVRFCASEGVPITARGGASGLAGQAVGEGIVLDFKKYFTAMNEPSADGRSIRVQPGVTLENLNRRLAPRGLRFAPDPSSGRMATIGGMLANNAAGARAIRYGATKDHVLELDVVLADGTLAAVRSDMEGNDGPALKPYARALGAICGAYADKIDANWPDVHKTSSGYNLRDLAGERGPDLTKIIVGSEGTLALIVGARLALVKLPAVRGCGLLMFDSAEAAGEGVAALRELRPSAIEYMDRSLFDIANQAGPNYALDVAVPEKLHTALLVEIEGDDIQEVRDRFSDMESRFGSLRLLHYESAFDPADQARIWRARKAALPLLNQMPGERKPVDFVEDAAVHPDRFPQYITGLEKIFRRHDVPCSMFGHAGSGNVHTKPVMKLSHPEDLARMEGIARDVADLVKGLRGTLTGEHGDGLLRAPYLPFMFGSLYPAFREVKKLFDPEGILNPGKIVSDAPSSIAERLKDVPPVVRFSPGPSAPFDRLVEELDKCTNCGTCLDYCPVSIQTRDEKASARAKANLVKSILWGQLPSEAAASGEVKAVMDLCFDCKQCLSDCPTRVDIPWIVQEMKAHHVRRRGAPLSARALGESYRCSAVSSALAPLSNLAASFAPARTVVEKTMGVSAKRRLPAASRATLGKRWRPHPDRIARVAYFPGCFAQFNEVEDEGLALAETLAASGIDVCLPQWRCCGVAKIANGQQDEVLDDARFNVDRLAESIDAGMDVVYTAPSCGLAIVEEYPRLLGTEKARHVAKHVFEIHRYLIRLKKEGRLNENFGRMEKTVVYHNPCHLRSQGIEAEPLEVLSWIPGLKLAPVKDSCCGIAGTFGMKAETFDLSMRIGRPLFEEIRAAAPESVVTSCGTCKMQIEQGTNVVAVHPLALLRDSYRAARKQGPPRG